MDILERTELVHWVEEHPREIQSILINMVEYLAESEGAEIVKIIKLFPYELEHMKHRNNTIIHYKEEIEDHKKHLDPDVLYWLNNSP